MPWRALPCTLFVPNRTGPKVRPLSRYLVLPSDGRRTQGVTWKGLLRIMEVERSLEKAGWKTVAQTSQGDERQEIKALASESSWLQKALFALKKAQAARVAQGEAMGLKEPNPLIFNIGRRKVDLDDVMTAMEEHATAVMEEATERRLSLR